MASFSPYFKGTIEDTDIYYFVGDFRTHSKVEAMLMADNDINRVGWSFMDRFWAQQDWSCEPKESIEDLMLQRAQQLRESASYLSLWYSGGYDSQTILDIFVNNGIKLDEILIYRRDYLVHHQGQELEFQGALREAMRLKNSVWPDLYIRVVEFNCHDLEHYYKKYGDSWILQPGSQLTLTKSLPSFTYNFNQRVREVLDIYQRVDIEGRDKPRLWIENGKWYATCYDTAFEWQGNSASQGFYIHPDFAKLHIKQTWMMINWLESLPIFDVDNLHSHLHHIQGHKLGVHHYRDWNLSIGRYEVKNIGSYNTIISGSKVWHSGDVTKTLESQPAREFFQKERPDIYDLYIRGICDIKQICPMLFNDDGSVRMIKSANHYIKPVEPARLFGKVI